jgi:hypothetical protein
MDESGEERTVSRIGSRARGAGRLDKKQAGLSLSPWFDSVSLSTMELESEFAEALLGEAAAPPSLRQLRLSASLRPSCSLFVEVED